MADSGLVQFDRRLWSKHKARKDWVCHYCHVLIPSGTEYMAGVLPGSGVGGMIGCDRAHLGCVDPEESYEQELCDKWNKEHPIGTRVLYTDYWRKKHVGTTGEAAKVVYGKAVVWLNEPDLAARYELDQMQVLQEGS